MPKVCSDCVSEEFCKMENKGMAKEGSSYIWVGTANKLSLMLYWLIFKEVDVFDLCKAGHLQKI